MSLPEPFNRYRNELEAEMNLIVGESSLPLYNMIRYHLGWEDAHGFPRATSGSKLLRPTLCLLSCEATGGNWHIALPAAAAVELLHNFTLVHDDIQDRSYKRRGKTTVWKLWGAAHGINVGDAIHALSQLALLRLEQNDVPKATILKAGYSLDHTCLKLCEGQYQDISYESVLDASVGDYLEMAEKKTALLIECSVRLGAILGTDNERTIQSLCSFGRNLGLAFQICNDMLDIWGIKEQPGSKSLSDIKRKKKTLSLIYTLEKAQEDDKKTLIEIYNKRTVTSRDADLVLQIMNSVGAYNYTESMINKYHSEAVKKLDSLKISPAIRKELGEVASFILKGSLNH
jgi:geranylgeranyl diphosphate synthase type I